ncbi:DUF4136 domain-containing protein [Mucilaginibacter sp.]|uniref:DUF4136 domain-containing protein n=1 Tax=Mucilaginibacter sp. TaxID=1882438 RepID=UPI000CA657A7|nr:DUF4136 domain-containing protein [Mucilaginibacter sp.]PLW90970.1 MAG: hypothetical protein C0154_03610 [Mucilaginibacter sp.]PMP66319.1 MAG: hypothetical protein C0191_00570 [Mucilaginibacter sp.]HEK21339.1 DUF4136 domain-containing protein [Bacteroidota bacterium]
MKIKMIIPGLLLLIAVGCGTAYKLAYSDADQTVDFRRYKTFSWLPHQDNDNTPYHNQIIFNNTISYFSHELAARGMTVDNENPDVLLELKVTESKKSRTESVPATAPVYNYNNAYRYRAISPHNPYYNANPRAYYYSRPYNYNTYTYGYTTRTIEYTRGGITLNVIDKNQNKFIYTATVEADLYDPATIQKDLHPAVHTLLENFPVKAPNTGKQANTGH